MFGPLSPYGIGPQSGPAVLRSTGPAGARDARASGLVPSVRRAAGLARSAGAHESGRYRPADARQRAWAGALGPARPVPPFGPAEPSGPRARGRRPAPAPPRWPPAPPRRASSASYAMHATPSAPSERAADPTPDPIPGPRPIAFAATDHGCRGRRSLPARARARLGRAGRRLVAPGRHRTGWAAVTAPALGPPGGPAVTPTHFHVCRTMSSHRASEQA